MERTKSAQHGILRAILRIMGVSHHTQA